MSEVIPAGWHLQAMADIVSVEYGKSPKKVVTDNGPYPVIGTGGVTGYASAYLHPGNTTVIGRKGTINKPSFLSEKFWAIDTTYYVTQYKSTDPKWFYYALSSLDLSAFNEASGVPSLNRETLYAIPFLSPPLTEQQKIATILSSVDDVIEKTRAQIDKLKDLKTGMMQELLTQGIGHTQFKDSAIGRIPSAWNIAELADLTQKDRPITYGIVQTGPHISDGIACVRVVDLMERQLSDKKMIRTSIAISQQYKRTVLREGDIMFALRGDIGHVRMAVGSLVGANLTRGVGLIAPNNKAHGNYLLWALRSPIVRKTILDGVNGSALQEIPLSNLRNVLVPVPPPQEQQKIAHVMTSINKKLEKVVTKLEALTNLKISLMQDLLTGKVRVKVDSPETVAA